MNLLDESEDVKACRMAAVVTEHVTSCGKVCFKEEKVATSLPCTDKQQILFKNLGAAQSSKWPQIAVLKSTLCSPNHFTRHDCHSDSSHAMLLFSPGV